jgi:antitoxin component YwqK of YwqJK toxin-antitoxin module
MHLYCKISPYIIEIELLYEEDINSWQNIVNSGFNRYCIYPNRSKIYNIEDITGKKYNELSIESTIFKIDDLIDKFMRGYENKEIAFFEDFIEKKEYELFENGYSGPYKQYWCNGVLQYQIFLLNGKEYGEFISYHSNNNLHIIGNKINGKFVGEVKVFDTDGKTLILTEYY